MMYGLLAEFSGSAALLRAVRTAREKGFCCVDAHTPFPIEGMEEAIGFSETRLPLIVGLAGTLTLIGVTWGLWYVDTRFLPIYIGGRPLASWPAYAIPGFEATVLIAAIAAVVVMLWMNRLPKLHHPLFAVERFARATQDRFFLLIRADDPLFEAEATRSFLANLGAEAVEEVGA